MEAWNDGHFAKALARIASRESPEHNGEPRRRNDSTQNQCPEISNVNRDKRRTLALVAIVTGAASGMGLALTRSLVAKGWKVGMADVNSGAGEKYSQELGPNTFFKKVDISNYDEQAAFFDEVWRWGGGRLDFLAANAGKDFAENLYSPKQPLDESGIPLPLGTKILDLMLNAVVQGIWLFRYYSKKDEGKGGKVVITASTAGIYPFFTQPLYSAAKHALVGLTRSIGPKLRKEGIQVNAICPGFAATDFLPKKMREVWPQEHLTSMEAIVQAFNTFLDDGKLSGQILEVSSQEQVFRKMPGFGTETTRWTWEDSSSLFSKVDKERAKL